MSIIVLCILAACFGAISHDFFQYWVSQLISIVRKKSPLVGQWELTYKNDSGEDVTETLRVFSEFADVSYGDLYAQMEDGSKSQYRVRFEYLFNNHYSVVFKPAQHPKVDVGLGIVTVNYDDRTASAKTLGLSKARSDANQTAWLREVSGAKV